MTYEWMRKIGHPDAYMGWVTVSKQLLTAEHFDVAQLCLAKRDPDWEPNADLFEIILDSMCSPDEDRTMLYVTRIDTIENASLALDIDSDPAPEDLKDPEDEGPDYALTEEDEDDSDSEDAIDIPRVNFDAALVVLYELLEVSPCIYLHLDCTGNACVHMLTTAHSFILRLKGHLGSILPVIPLIPELMHVPHNSAKSKVITAVAADAASVSS